MNPIEHYAEEHKKINHIHSNTAQEKQRRLDIAEEHIRSLEAKGISRKKIFEKYMKEYFKEFLDHSPAQSMNPAERYNYLKELIYFHKRLHETEEENIGAKKKAAQPRTA